MIAAAVLAFCEVLILTNFSFYEGGRTTQYVVVQMPLFGGGRAEKCGCFVARGEGKFT